jgi:alpha-L-arabinofuranosidase
VAVSANGLQPDGQNDNGWDQGLLFLNPSHVWLQPPGYVTRMMAQNYQPQWLRSEVADPKAGLDVVATRSENGKILVLQVVNVGANPVSATVNLHGYKPSWPKATVQELAGSLDARNTADQPTQIAPRSETWTHEFAQGPMKRLFSAHSFTIIRFE